MQKITDTSQQNTFIKIIEDYLTMQNTPQS